MKTATIGRVRTLVREAHQSIRLLHKLGDDVDPAERYVLDGLVEDLESAAERLDALRQETGKRDGARMGRLLAASMKGRRGDR
jgi:hypothetical protein